MLYGFSSNSWLPVCLSNLGILRTTNFVMKLSSVERSRFVDTLKNVKNFKSKPIEREVVALPGAFTKVRLLSGMCLLEIGQLLKKGLLWVKLLP